MRQARDLDEADRQAVEAAARQAAQDTGTTWARMQAGLAAIHADTHQVASDGTALRGYQLEYTAGLRSTLDVLIADENLRSAPIALATARHDTTVAEAALLAAIDKLETRRLLLGQPSTGGRLSPRARQGRCAMGGRDRRAQPRRLISSKAET